MSSDGAYLALLLDAPMQSWGFSSRFQRRTTGLYPTKSGVVGMLCAAMGLAKGSPEEGEILVRMAKLGMTTIVLPRTADLTIRRLEDYHTVGGGYDPQTERQFITRTASNQPNVKKGQAVAVVTHRQYLLDARFGVILHGDRTLLELVAAKLRDPVWGIWFGRKSCIPAAPILPDPQGTGVYAERRAAWEALLVGSYRLSGREVPAVLPDQSSFDRVEETDSSAEAIRDVPVSFGDGAGSGPDKREFAVRRVSVRPGQKSA